MAVPCRGIYWIYTPHHLLALTKHWIYYCTPWICHLCLHTVWNFMMCLRSSTSHVLLLQGAVALSLAFRSKGRQLVYLLLTWGRVEPPQRECKLFPARDFIFLNLNEEWSIKHWLLEILLIFSYSYELHSSGFKKWVLAITSLTSLKLDNIVAVWDS